MPATYDVLATTTLTTNTQSILFSNISQSYTDLVVIARIGGVVGSDVRFRFNGDSSNNYSYNSLYADSGGIGAFRNTGFDPQGPMTYLAGCNTTVGATMHRLDIFNYTDTGKKKMSLSSANNATDSSWTQNAGIWNSTNAITSMDIQLSFAGSRNMLTGSTITMYGILRA